MMDSFMQAAYDEAKSGMDAREGGPFGAVVVKDGEIISRAHNEVVASNDPTAHAEVLAIRRAAQSLGRFKLDDCELYTTCEPCPMCAAALHWARMPKVHFACTAQDATDAGFDDKLMYEEFRGSKKSPVIKANEGRDECLRLFDEWKARKHTQY